MPAKVALAADTVTPAVNGNRNLDVVHRAVGRPGVILVGEGVPSRVSGLLAAEKKKTARVAFEVPIFEFQVGDGEGQIPVRQLQRKIMRLPRNLKPAADLGMTTVLVGAAAAVSTAPFIDYRTQTLTPFLNAARLKETFP